jgi:opacity protein-like surface antigen
MKNAMIVTALVMSCGAGYAQEFQLVEPSGMNERNHSVYVGLGFGPTTLTTSGDQREVDGIDFTFDTEADDLGSMFYLGGWISEHVGAEIGIREYGTINVPFAFSNPHDNTSGTGESEVSMSGVNVSLLLGTDIGERFQIVGRVGALMWREDFESRFDIPGSPAVNAETEDSGVGFASGLGLSYQVKPGWQLETRFEYATLGDDEVSLLTFGLAYDFIGLTR